ncbi:Myelin expression factor 2 isoform 3 [Schistosoma japonicum]|uniref:Myelin expression factor 2 isoform 3 n=1 Tax=Schistosoma japonicum TaxID=6182 RepID=A0A4Z2DII3_SCHJA|nr:Myelin expression factor 2 isoform 3 [Schistosoma japonicum]
MSTLSGESHDDQSSTRHRSPIDRGSRSRSPRRVRVTSKRIVIANIPYDLNWQKLKELFREQIGFTGFLQLFKVNGRPNGMGLMEFKTLEGAQKAIETMHRFEIGDRKLVVREETARDAARIASMEVDGSLPSDSNPSDSTNTVSSGPIYTPQVLSQMGIEGPVTDSVYVSNLDYSVTWRKLKDVFKLAGKVTSSIIKTDAEGNSRGVGILKFSHPYEAVQAVSMFNNQILKDRPMRVKIDRQGTPASSSILYPPQKSNSSGILGSTCSMIPSSPIITGQQQSSNIIAALMTLLGLKTNIDSNPQSGIVEILRSLASNASLSGGLNALAPTGSSNNSLNFIGQSLSTTSDVSSNSGVNRSFSSQLSNDGLQQLISAAVAGGMSQSQINSVLSTLGLFQNSHSDQSGHLNTSNIVGRRSGGVAGDRSVDRSHFNNGYVGRSIKYEDSESPDIPSRGSYYRSSGGGRSENGSQYNNDNRHQIPAKLVVKNLPFSFDSHDVKSIFREVGELSNCNLVTDSQGRSQGIAFITYTNVDNIYRAIDAFNGKMFEGRRLRVHAE